MAFQRGETVICSIEWRDDDNALTDPDTSMTITITDPRGVVIVDGVVMTNDSVGCYHYDYGTTATSEIGQYRARYTAVHQARTTIEDQTFELEK